MIRIVFCILMVALACGFTPPDARFSRSGDPVPLPPGPRQMQSEDQIWKHFAQCKLRRNQDFSYGIAYTPEVKAMNGRQTVISGFMLPLEAKEKFTHFILSKRAPTCAFCPPGAPNEVVEVFTSEPVKWQEDLVTVSGTLTLASDNKRGIFFLIKNATVK
ncbi:DUF3299 domain-containing protein [Geobacter sp. SVR]|uniref:DUF3299 domain-containing protein n=1 Tax=Geobacter sp. SVR TaxID=2495594 RepID=UPI00143F02E1|nr:DUF3299 domain-containing protein [Geobacter sp. SVR]BCS53208.1 hypothetical protein GSVR_15160 [Geobacter sp. SVR]GCF84593.1 hypothetical protein GSbR_11930 [Geobacter sp. SVR]